LLGLSQFQGTELPSPLGSNLPPDRPPSVSTALSHRCDTGRRRRLAARHALSVSTARIRRSMSRSLSFCGTEPPLRPPYRSILLREGSRGLSARGSCGRPFGSARAPFPIASPLLQQMRALVSPNSQPGCSHRARPQAGSAPRSHPGRTPRRSEGSERSHRPHSQRPPPARIRHGRGSCSAPASPRP